MEHPRNERVAERRQTRHPILGKSLRVGFFRVGSPRFRPRESAGASFSSTAGSQIAKEGHLTIEVMGRIALLAIVLVCSSTAIRGVQPTPTDETREKLTQIYSLMEAEEQTLPKTETATVDGRRRAASEAFSPER